MPIKISSFYSIFNCYTNANFKYLFLLYPSGRSISCKPCIQSHAIARSANMRRILSPQCGERTRRKGHCWCGEHLKGQRRENNKLYERKER